ncbi:twin-arginine translocase subunit TatC [bacterium]|nr:twin-arginine translocase subunit TatC [bacterium]
MPDLEEEARSQMPLWQHLDELRSGVFRSLIAIAVGFAIAYAFIDPIMAFLEKPLTELLPEGEAHLYYTGLTDKFVVYLKVCVLAGSFFMSPYLLYEFWRFISPALYRNERRFLIPFLAFGTVSFGVGLAFAYWVVIPYGYKFLIEFGSPNERAIITLTEYFSLTLKLLLALGIVFEVPVLLVLLGKFGVLDASFLTRNRRYAAVVSAVVAAVATPSPDALTMVLVMVPLYLLYEVGIVGVRLVQPAT